MRTTCSTKALGAYRKNFSVTNEFLLSKEQSYYPTDKQEVTRNYATLS